MGRGKRTADELELDLQRRAAQADLHGSKDWIDLLNGQASELKVCSVGLVEAAEQRVDFGGRRMIPSLTYIGRTYIPLQLALQHNPTTLSCGGEPRVPPSKGGRAEPDFVDFVDNKVAQMLSVSQAPPCNSQRPCESVATERSPKAESYICTHTPTKT